MFNVLLNIVYFLFLLPLHNNIEAKYKGFSSVTNYLLNFTKCIVADEECPSQHIRFFLYNRKIVEKEGSFEILPNSVMSAPFVNDKQLIVLIHGYTGHKDYSPNMELRPAFLLKDDYNIISVDWSPLAKSPCYVQAAVNTDVVGKCTAYFLSNLYQQRSEETSCDRTHVIGFSLGAHCAGDTGKYLIQTGCKLPWITGLDPALPLFSEIASRPGWTIDDSDAYFVDVIHTNVGWKGQFGPQGHVDFYINSGYIQPGCISNTSCDHVRAVEIYRESIVSEKGFYGLPCGLYIKSFLFGFVHDVCIELNPSNFNNSEPILMGIHVPHEARGTYQLMTSDQPPYMRSRY